MKLTNQWLNFAGKLSVHEHNSAICHCPMKFAVFTPPQAHDGPVPVLWYLSGLTCDWSNVMEKSNIQRSAAQHGIMIIAPDTSPRSFEANHGTHQEIANDDAYDLGQGAGFYLTATQKPWTPHFAMDQYITQELPQIIAENFPVDMSRQGITGHSMGGHGALTLHLKNQHQYQSVSAFSPIVAPSRVPWGQKAFTAYLGTDQKHWQDFDATHLVARNPSTAHILIDQGGNDNFLEEQLKSHLFEEACQKSGQKLTLNIRDGYDHSYYFIASFIDAHLSHHASTLCTA